METQPEAVAELERRAEPAPARDAKPQRYKVQFTATDQYVALLERAKALLSHTGADKSLEQVHLRALQALVAELEKRRFGVGAKPRAESTKRARAPRQRGARGERASEARSGRTEEGPITKDARASRHIPAAVRREVWERDGGRYTCVDERGQPFARGGPPTAENISLRCRAHNRLAAEHDFGRELMDRKIGPPRPAVP